MGELKLRLSNHRKSLFNVGYYFLASFIPMVINLFLSPLYSLNLSAEDFAIVGYYSSFQSIVFPLMLFEMHQYYLREYYFRSEEERIVLRSTLFKTFLFFPFIILLLSYFGIYCYVRFLKADINFPFFPYALLTLLPWALAGIYRMELIDRKVRREAKSYFNISITNSALLILCTVTFVVGFKWGATGKLLGVAIPSIIMFVWAFSRHIDSLKAPMDWRLLKTAMWFCLPLVIAAMLQFFSGGYDKVYLERYVSLDQLGIYTVGLSIAGYLNVFSSAIGETFNPDIYESIAQKNNKKAFKYIVIQFVMMAVIVMVFILLARYLIIILTANRYVDSTPYARIASISAITSLTYNTVTPFIYSAKKTNIILITKILGSIACVFTYSILIKNYGLYGASWGVVICPLYFSLFALLLYKNQSILHLRKDNNK